MTNEQARVLLSANSNPMMPLFEIDLDYALSTGRNDLDLLQFGTSLVPNSSAVATQHHQSNKGE